METTNYEMFSFMKTNRTIGNGLVERLMKSINSIGYVVARPIIVNESMVVIDGQHRLEACKRLNIPVHYEISNVNMHDAMLQLNMNQEIWRLNEYIQSYANSGIYCYKELVKFEDKYHLGVSNNIVICNSGYTGKSIKIRNGVEFDLNENRDKIALFLIACRPYLSFYKHKTFVNAVVLLHKKTNNDNCIKVLNKLPSIKQQVLVSDYLCLFENILNRHKHESNRVKLTI